MLRALTSLFTTLFLMGSALAVASPAESQLQLKPLIFKFEKNGVTFKVLGTIHDISAQYFPKWIFEEIDSASKVVFELPQIEKLAKNKDIKLPAGQTLKALISEDAWKRLGEELKDPEMLKEINLVKPAIAFLSLQTFRRIRTIEESARVHRMAEFNKSVDGSMDSEIYDRAKKLKIPVGSLESVNQQLEGFFITARDFESYVMQPRAESDLEVETIVAMTTQTNLSYFKGDPRFLIGMLKQLNEDQFYDMFTKRNLAWAPQMNRAEHGTLYVVGAGHLLSSTGIRALMRAQGWKVSVARECDSQLTN